MVPLGVVSYSPSTVTKALSWREACSVTEVEERIQGRSDGGGISVYIPPKSVTILFTCGTLTHVLKLQ